jgi:hypothetical protein
MLQRLFLVIVAVIALALSAEVCSFRVPVLLPKRDLCSRTLGFERSSANSSCLETATLTFIPFCHRPLPLNSRSSPLFFLRPPNCLLPA